VNSNFGFLLAEWPELAQEARQAEVFARRNPRVSAFYARRAAEAMVEWIYTAEGLDHPYKADFASLLHEPAFKQLVSSNVWNKLNSVRKNGNAAVHGKQAPQPLTAEYLVQEVFHSCYWLARTYARDTGNLPPQQLTFDPSFLAGPAKPTAPSSTVQPAAVEKDSAEEVAKLAEKLDAKDSELAKAAQDNAQLEMQLAELREQIAVAKVRNEKIPDQHDYAEAETRARLIDPELRWAGWELDQPENREFKVDTMPTPDGRLSGIGYVDYVLWGEDGLPLALIEAKSTIKDGHIGKQQAKLYADCLERRFGRRPVIYFSNGYHHWLWDDVRYPEREVSGFHTRDELQLMISRRTSRHRLAQAPIDNQIVERGYQLQAIRAVTEAFENKNERKALLVMATGTGKTRTVVALTKLLQNANWAKRVLFLADRIALVDQAAKAFKTHLPNSGPVVLGRDRPADSRIHVATYPTMMNLINGRADDGAEQQEFGVGHYDLIIIDEAHRSVYQKYREIFEFFDSFLVGLTATPVAEVDRNTYSLFDIEDCVPTFAYELDQAIAAGYLVPPRAVPVPLKFPASGIHYDELSDDEKARWDDLEWDEDGEIPDAVDASAINTLLFNTDTVNKVLETLMERGHKVEGGDRIGKTIIFARNNRHAQFIAEQFDKQFPQYKSHLARVITYQTEYAGSLIGDFSKQDSTPHIAISVDMLDTGVDVPEVVNLVFFKPVRSKTKFWQMIGRGTRLCEDLYGPGQDKEDFFVFDVCGNIDFFNAGLAGNEGATGASLGERLFATRTALLRTTARAGFPGTDPLRADLAFGLRLQVERMPRSNFMVRRQIEQVERFSESAPWMELIDADVESLGRALAPVAPLGAEPEREETKRFDLLMLSAELAGFDGEAAVERYRGLIQDIAAALQAKTSIPAIAAQLPVIDAVLDPHEWESVSVHWLEQVRKNLRGLVHLIDKKKRNPVYTDFQDSLGEIAEVELKGVVSSNGSFERYRERARQYLRAHLDSASLQRLRRNKPLTELDLGELERMLLASGAGSEEDLERAREGGLAGFVRSLVGLDRDAVQESLSEFIGDSSMNSSQMHFLQLVVDHLCENGEVPVKALYDPPFTDAAPSGPDDLLGEVIMDRLVHRLKAFELDRVS